MPARFCTSDWSRSGRRTPKDHGRVGYDLIRKKNMNSQLKTKDRFRIFTLLYLVVRQPFTTGNCCRYIHQCSSKPPNSFDKNSNFIPQKSDVPGLPLYIFLSLLGSSLASTKWSLIFLRSQQQQKPQIRTISSRQVNATQSKRKD